MFSVDEDLLEQLLRSVPFSPGSEYIDPEWIAAMFERLHGIFADEIRAFTGSIELYFADKSQHLRVPERIFFHLVENRGDDSEDGTYPFAFVATYSTKTKAGKLAHKPLQYV